MSAEDIINNPPKVFTEPCFACGVSEFQLGVKHAEDRIIKLLESYFKPEEAKAIYPADYEQYLDIIALIKGEQK